MTGFLLAVQFLTSFPLKIKHYSAEKKAASVIFFPVVGLLLGFLLAGINGISGILGFGAFPGAVILVVALVVLTAGMHIDGLSDTFDAFLSGKPKEEMLLIMRDPHAGAMGVLSIISVLLLEVALLFSIPAPAKTIALLLACIISRWSAVLQMFVFPYARQDGKAGVFMKGMNHRIFFTSAIITFLLVFIIARLKGLMVLFLITLISFLLGRASEKKINGITGDTLGATIVITEIFIFFTMYCLEG